MFEVDSTKRRTFGLFVPPETDSTEAKHGNLVRSAWTNSKSGEANNKISMSMHIAGLRLTKFANWSSGKNKLLSPPVHLSAPESWFVELADDALAGRRVTNKLRLRKFPARPF